MKKVFSAALAILLTLTLCTVPALAKTLESARADNIFFYAMNAEGKSVLLKVLTLDEVKTLAHGQEDGKNYSISTTDNYPTTQYCEARGITVNELVDYVKSVTTVEGADALRFSGADTIGLMGTDSYGYYSRSWTWDELYGVSRYYFEGLYDKETGWNTGWEITGTDNSMFGVTMEEYNASYKDSDPYYENKRSVFEGGVETTVILATESYSGRTTTDSLTTSTEPGIASYITANGGTVAGCLADAITDECALRLSLPMTEADLMAAHRTAYDNFRWIYNLRLSMADAPDLPSQGTVAEPVQSFSLNGNTLTITFDCATAGADIYYGYDGSPQILYTGPITVDVSDRDLTSNPVVIYATAVKEGYDDAGVLTFQYPGMAPSFQTVRDGITGTDLVFTAMSSVSSTDWAAWTDALNFITYKTPSAGGYVTLEQTCYTVDNTAKTITFDKALFTETGSYSFICHATQFADKSISATIKQAAPALSVPRAAVWGTPLTVTFEDEKYNNGLSVYITPEGGERKNISSTYLDRTQAGQVTLKEEYFTLDSTAMPGTGTYTLELSNNSYSPTIQAVTVTLTSGFTDVPPNEWYYPYVTDLTAAGLVSGVGNGLFMPGQPLKWGEALKVLLLAAGEEEPAPTGEHWASGYVDLAVSAGLVETDVEPDAAISRLEFCRAAAKAMGLETTLTQSPFSDTDDPGVLALYEHQIVDGVGDGRFAPEDTLTRAQISKVIWFMINMETKGETT